eukprot:GHVS01044032.1.p1 GENE.GHVS01044032.1~~GHVS01044032.1.p1  ORF type:complete len:430 (+),score=55.26 GHVS01044032.1:26-1291(+)
MTTSLEEAEPQVGSSFAVAMTNSLEEAQPKVGSSFAVAMTTSLEEAQPKVGSSFAVAMTTSLEEAQPQRFVCVSCGTAFVSEVEHRQHYRSDWHRYNLRRRVADMAPVSEEAYTRRVEILLSADFNVRGQDHLGLKRRQPYVAACPRPSVQPKKQQNEYIGPLQCIFDDTVFEDVQSNVKYMGKKYSLFIPNAEYLVNLEGLIRYLGEKVNKSRQCLFCDRQFNSAEAVRMHMVSKGHTLIGTETEEMRAEIEDFYDFRPSYKQLAKKLGKQTVECVEDIQQAQNDSVEQDSNDEWEDFDDEIAGDEPADAKLGVLLSKFGCKRTHVTGLGNLQLPDGRSVGHRNLSYVYKQNLRPMQLQTHTSYRALKNEEETRTATVLCHKEKEEMLKYHRRFLRSQMRLGVKQNALQKYIRKREMCYV